MRKRAISITALIVAGLIALISLVPMPYRTGAEGVVWIPEESIVRAGTEGFIDRIVAEPGSRVEAGTPLLTLSNPPLTTHERITEAYVKELEAKRVQYLSTDLVKADMAQDDLRQARERLSRAQSEVADLTIRSRVAGTFIVPVPEDLPSRFVKKGELLGYIVDVDRMTVRTAVSQTIIDLVRSRTEGAEVRLSERVGEVIPAVIKRVVPGGTEDLPARQLGTSGGGKIAIDPTDRQGMKALQNVFQVDLEIPTRSEAVKLGGRAYVRFDHGWAPLAVQWYFQIRQIFLSRFNV